MKLLRGSLTNNMGVLRTPFHFKYYRPVAVLPLYLYANHNYISYHN